MSPLQTPLTTLILILTCITSIRAFNDRELLYRSLFRPIEIQRRREYYRFLSSLLVHADWLHLGFNMFALWSFGSIVEYTFTELFGALGWLYYLLLYGVGGIVASVPTYLRHQHNSMYSALGASGAVSAVVYAVILLFPASKIGFFIPGLTMPAIVFGAAYLLLSSYMARYGNDNIGHEQHFTGAIFGFAFTLLLSPTDFWERFVAQIGMLF